MTFVTLDSSQLVDAQLIQLYCQTNASVCVESVGCECERERISMGTKISYAVKNLGMGFEETIAAFLRSRKLGNGGANRVNSERPIYEYRYDTERFFKHFNGKTYYNEITEADMTSFLEDWQS